MRAELYDLKRICLIAAVWTSFFIAQTSTGARLVQEAPLQEAPSKDEPDGHEGRPQLRLGLQKRSTGNAFTVALEFISNDEMKANQIRAEIILPQEPWRFRKVQAAAGSALKVSAKQRREKRIAAGGAEQESPVLFLTISSGKPIPSGAIAELLFTRQGPDDSSAIPLVIRSYEIGSPGGPSSSQPPLEPPPVEPPANPAPSCFFFTH